MRPKQRDYLKSIGIEAAMTHEEIGEILGISRVTSSWIEKNAIKKLRKALEGSGIGVEDLLREWHDEFNRKLIG